MMPSKWVRNRKEKPTPVGNYFCNYKTNNVKVSNNDEIVNYRKTQNFKTQKWV